jgi:hypothetical protein
MIRACNIPANIVRFVVLEFDFGFRLVETKFSTVSSRDYLRHAMHLNEEVPDCLICRLTWGNAHEFRVPKPIRLVVFARLDKGLEFPEMLMSIQVCRGIRRAAPQRIFIELDSFTPYTPEHHPAKATVSNGKGFLPCRSRLLVPQGAHGMLVGVCGCRGTD